MSELDVSRISVGDCKEKGDMRMIKLRMDGRSIDIETPFVRMESEGKSEVELVLRGGVRVESEFSERIEEIERGIMESVERERRGDWGLKEREVIGSLRRRGEDRMMRVWMRRDKRGNYKCRVKDMDRVDIDMKDVLGEHKGKRVKMLLRLYGVVMKERWSRMIWMSRFVGLESGRRYRDRLIERTLGVIDMMGEETSDT